MRTLSPQISRKRRRSSDSPALTPSGGRRRSHPMFNIGRNTPEPETVTYDQGGKKVTTGGPKVDPRKMVSPSRHFELLTERQTDRFIRSVKKRRKEMAEHAEYLRKHFGPNASDLWLPSQYPRIAGGAGGTQQGVESNPASAAGSVIPFCQASKRGIEPGPSWNVTPGAAQQQLGPVGLPAQGFLRAVEIYVKTSKEGKGAGGELEPKAPFNILADVRFQDTNGNQLDDVPGYTLFLDNVYGGYSGCPDPRVDPDYEASSALKPSFQVGVWRELAPNGFGSIANMSSSQQYKLTLRVATEAEIFKKKPAESLPELEILTYCHFWQLPQAESMDKRRQITTPPFHGTTQYRWWSPSNSVKQAFKLKIEQVGNEMRNLVLLGETEAKAMSWAVFPDPLLLRWDTEMLVITSLASLRKIMRELTNDIVSVPTGALCLPWNFGEGRFVGGSGVNSWLPTVTATRLEITGTQPASTPGEVGVFANDVSVAEINPALRPAVPGPGGYTPQVAPRLAGAQ